MNDFTPFLAPSTSDDPERFLPAVPAVVWRIRPLETDVPGSLGSRLADRLVATYSRPGDIVLDFTADSAVSGACVRGRRRPRPAWFSDVSGVTLGLSELPSDLSSDGVESLSPAVGEPAAVGVWFGDDLTEQQRGRAGSLSVAAMSSMATLAVVPSGLVGPDALPWLLADCSRLSARGACLLVTTHRPASATAAATLLSAAQTAGLRPIQRVAVVSAGSGPERFSYPGDEELLTLADERRHFVDGMAGVDILVLA
jgi:hypothetical protein